VRSVLANRLRIAVVATLALLALLVTVSLWRVAAGAAALALTLLLLLPLALALPGLLRGNARSGAWATLCVTPYIVYGLTETIANPATRLTATVDRMWETDSEVLPTRLSPCASAANPTRGLAVDQVSLDNVFSGWNGAAEIVWPERKARLRMEADAPLRVLVLYTPPDADFFCAEPVSNVTDAFNMPDDQRDSGLIVLGPGESARAAVRFMPRIESVT